MPCLALPGSANFAKLIASARHQSRAPLQRSPFVRRIRRAMTACKYRSPRPRLVNGSLTLGVYPLLTERLRRMPPRRSVVDFMHLWELAESSVQWLSVVVRVRIYRWIESWPAIASSDFESFLPDPSIS